MHRVGRLKDRVHVADHERYSLSYRFEMVAEDINFPSYIRKKKQNTKNEKKNTRYNVFHAQPLCVTVWGNDTVRFRKGRLLIPPSRGGERGGRSRFWFRGYIYIYIWQWLYKGCAWKTLYRVFFFSFFVFCFFLRIYDGKLMSSATISNL
jgi:hypothetical protein